MNKSKNDPAFLIALKIQKYSKFLASHKKLKTNETRKLFRQIIQDLNNLAKHKGFQNYWLYRMDQAKVPQKSINSYLKSLDYLLSITKTKPVKNYKQIKLPDDIINFCIKNKILSKSKVNKIKFIMLDDYVNRCQYVPKSDSAIIYINLDELTLTNIFSFMHELGHANHFLSLSTAKKDPLSTTAYERELNADLFMFDLGNKFFNKSEFQTYLWIRGLKLIDGYFEYLIYHNPRSNFEKLFTQTRKKFFNSVTQQKISRYLFNKNFILRPCDISVGAIAYSEVLIKKQNQI